VASAGHPSLYQWRPVPLGKIEATSYIDTALAWLEKRFGELYKSEVARQETPIVAFRELRPAVCPPDGDGGTAHVFASAEVTQASSSRRASTARWLRQFKHTAINYLPSARYCLEVKLVAGDLDQHKVTVGVEAGSHVR
jgi:hypothetical protein